LKKSISVVFPAFNEEENIEPLIRLALKFLPSLTNTYEVIIVDDGSKDDTGRIADNLARKHKEVIVLHHLFNEGYGAALRSGFKAAKHDLVFFTDADAQFDIGEIPKLTNLIKEADIVCGYRIKRADPVFRRVNAGLYNLAIRLLFGLKVLDIDCAFKLFKREVIRNLNLESTGALINAELLILAKKKGYVIKQVGVNHYPRKKGNQTGNKIRVVVRTFVELIKFWKKLR